MILFVTCRIAEGNTVNQSSVLTLQDTLATWNILKIDQLRENLQEKETNRSASTLLSQVLELLASRANNLSHSCLARYVQIQPQVSFSSLLICVQHALVLSFQMKEPVVYCLRIV